MAKYIEQNMLLTVLDSIVAPWMDYDDACEIVQNAPTIEIIKCPDCKYHQDNAPFHYCKKHGVYCPDDSEYFCAYGEREGVM